jgi:hypothetical protein
MYHINRFHDHLIPQGPQFVGGGDEINGFVRQRNAAFGLGLLEVTFLNVPVPLDPTGGDHFLALRLASE